MSHKIQDVLCFILQRFQYEGISLPGKTRLIKLFYLSEIEYYRAFKKRLTDATWRFYHFGPYSFEVENVLGRPQFNEEEVELPDQKILKQISSCVPAGQELLNDLSRAIITKIVKRWGDEELNVLLDHVYFETEPMEKAKRGEVLDFSGIKEPEVPREISLDPKKMEIVRDKLGALTESFRKRRYLKFNAEFDKENMKWDEEESLPTLKGLVIVGLEDTESENGR